MIFKTISGSAYEVDETNNRVRRLYGNKAPTKLQSADGEWKEFSHMTEVVVGKQVLFIWKEAAEGYIMPATTTNLVKEINGDMQ